MILIVNDIDSEYDIDSEDYSDSEYDSYDDDMEVGVRIVKNINNSQCFEIVSDRINNDNNSVNKTTNHFGNERVSKRVIVVDDDDDDDDILLFQNIINTNNIIDLNKEKIENKYFDEEKIDSIIIHKDVDINGNEINNNDNIKITESTQLVLDDNDDDEIDEDDYDDYDDTSLKGDISFLTTNPTIYTDIITPISDGDDKDMYNLIDDSDNDNNNNNNNNNSNDNEKYDTNLSEYNNNSNNNSNETNMYNPNLSISSEMSTYDSDSSSASLCF
jgi:hypothetical protein